MTEYALRLVAYNASGTRLQILPDVLEMDLSAALNDSSTLKFTYAIDGIGADLFSAETYTTTLLEFAVEVTNDGGRTWSEPPIGRFYVTDGKRDLLSTGETQISVSTQSVASRLGEAVLLLPQTGANEQVTDTYVDENLKTHYNSVTPGKVLVDAWSKAALRGWGGDLAYDFSAIEDSNGDAWSTSVSISLAAGTTIKSILDQLVSAQLVDWCFDGRTLRLFNPSTEAGDNKPLGPTHSEWSLPLGVGMTDAEESYSWADRCSRVIVEGEESRTWSIANPYLNGVVGAGINARAKEIYVKAQGVTEALGARRAAEPYFIQGSAVAETIKRSYRMSDLNKSPLIDFQVGAWILLERLSGYDTLRVQGITVSWDGMHATGDLTLGTKQDSTLAKLLKKTLTVDENGIRTSGGTPTNASTAAVATTASAAATTAQQALDQSTAGGATYDGGSDFQLVSLGTVTPAAPAITTYDFYGQLSDNGFWNGSCTLTWTHSGKNYDNSISLLNNWPQYIEVYVTDYTDANNPVALPDLTTQWWSGVGGTVSGLEAGHTYRINCRAYYVGSWSSYSNTVSGTVPVDNTPPPVPSAPTCVSAYQALQVTWDGLAANGSSGTPLDFDHLGIAVVTEGGVLTENYTTDGPAGRTLTLANLAQDTYDVALRAYDKRGNVSAWGARTTVAVTVTVDTNAIQSAVDTAMSAYDNTIGAAIDFAAGIQNLSSSLIEYGDVPPDSGSPGVSYWCAPDGKIWKLNTLVQS